MRSASFTACIFASLLLTGCAENAVPRPVTLQPLGTAEAFAITGVECDAAPGVPMTEEDLQRNRELALAALRSVTPDNSGRVRAAAKPVKLKVLFTSYRRGKVEIWKLVPGLGRMQLTADLSLVDGDGRSVGRYRFYNGFVIGGGLMSVSDVEAGFEQGLAHFVQNAGVDVAIPNS